MGAKKLSQEDIISKIDELPTLPSIVYELNNIINDPMSSTSDVERVMENDQSMTTKVLKLVNSAYYAIPGGVSNLGRAIGYIGFDTVHQLVLSASIIQALDIKGPTEFDVKDFWTHSVGVGIASETIATRVGHPMPADLFTCGLVHDMGKIALYSIDKEILFSIIEEAQKSDITYSEAEVALDIPSHNNIGKMLAEKWRLPLQFQSVIKYHHQKDPKLRGATSPEMNKNVDIVMLSNLLIHGLKFGNSGYSKIPGVPKELMMRLGISPTDDFKPMVKKVKESLDKAADFIRVLGS